MAKELTTRMRRRPLLAPLLIPMLGVLAAGAGIYWIGTWARTTVVILVRHAEAATSTNGDPDLSPAGEKRSAALGATLADFLGATKVDYLYAADTRRSQQTAAPVANQFKLPINLLASSDWAGLPGRIKREHRGKTVVVVGYAATLPTVLSQLSGGSVAMADDEFDSIYVVVIPSPGETRVFRLRYGEPGPGARTAIK
ncbi:MAG TPA: histidine phosphatase family protein [Steroidobacteraceae bacterium]